MREDIGKAAVTCTAIKIRMRVYGLMSLCVGDKSKEGLGCSRLSLDKVEGIVCDFAVHDGALSAVKNL